MIPRFPVNWNLFLLISESRSQMSRAKSWQFPTQLTIGPILLDGTAPQSLSDRGEPDPSTPNLIWAPPPSV